MAKFEGNYPQMPKEAPAWFKTFYDNYAFVIKFLNFAGKRGLNLNDNVLNTPVSGVFRHNKPTSIVHNIGTIPTIIVSQGGRYLSYTINNTSFTDVTITARLLSTPVTDTVPYDNITKVTVLDASIFVRNDTVLINGFDRKILQIVDNTLTFDVGIVLTLPATVTLNSETLNFVIF